MPPLDTPAALFAALALPVVSILFNLSNASAIYLDDSSLKSRADAGDRRAESIVAALSGGERLKLGVNVVSALCCAAGAASLAVYALPERLSPYFLWAVAAISVVYYALGVTVPRKLAAYFPGIAYPLSGFLTFFAAVSLPFAAAIGFLAAVAVRLFGGDPKNPPTSVTEEEIRMLVDEGSEHGAIEEEEMKMINNIFEFDDRDVSQILTHRTELAAIEISATLDEVMKIAIESGHSRLPVYKEDIDSICGIFHVKDLIKYISRPEDFCLADNLREPICVPESSSCSDVFELLKRERKQMAVVIDEYGGTYGIVTVEDLIESIVGSIQDEYDNEETEATRIEEGVYLLDGSISISDAELLLDFDAPDDSEADTLGGFVTELLGGLPHDDTDPRIASFGNITFEAVLSDERRIEQIRAVIQSGEE